jgi:hypothetical protein
MGRVRDGLAGVVRCGEGGSETGRVTDGESDVVRCRKGEVRWDM